MSMQFFTRLRFNFETANGGGFNVGPDLPADLLRIGTTISYPDDATAVVTFKRDLTTEEEAVLTRYGGIRSSEAKPTYDRSLRPADVADQEAASREV